MVSSPSKRKNSAFKQDRIFLDANILFSAAYGSPGLKRIWDLSRNGRCHLLVSGYVVEEARRNLFTPKQLETLEELVTQVEIVPDIDVRIPCPIDLPEKDRPVFMAALAAKVDILLTGDRTHFGPYFGQTIQGITILLPKDYLTPPVSNP